MHRDDFPSSYSPVASSRCSEIDAEGHVAPDPAGDRISFGTGETDRQVSQSEFSSVWSHCGQREGAWAMEVRGNPRRQVEAAGLYCGKSPKDPPTEKYECHVSNKLHGPAYHIGERWL